jgi:hypothetical protein
MSEAGNRKLSEEIGMMMLILLSTSCGITGVNQCGPEFRGAAMYKQVVLADGVSTANGYVSIQEMRDPSRSDTQVATYVIEAASDSLGWPEAPIGVRDHMTRVELRDTQTPSRLFGSYPPPPAPCADPSAPCFLLPLPRNLWFGGPYDWPVPVEDGLALLLSGQLVLEIQTDLPSQALVRIPLTALYQSNLTWTRTKGESCG